MGLIHGTTVLSSPTRSELQGFELRALTDSGAVHLCIPDQGVLRAKPDPPISSRVQ